LDNQFFTYYSPVQRSRVATAFDFIDFIRGKLLAAVLADHFVAFLVITETGTVTDIAGVNGSAENAVSTFDHKKSDHGAVLRLDLEMMGFAVAATVVLLLIQRHVIRLTGSTIVRADSLHYTTDLLTNLGTIAALALAHLGWPALDPLFGILVAIYICYGAWHIGYDAFHQLIDRELPDEVRERVKQLALAEPLVRGLHDLRTRQSGAMAIIQLHLELDAGLSLGEAHAATDRVEQAIRKAYPLADVIIHQDPA